jgi:hypothetical protein
MNRVLGTTFEAYNSPSESRGENYAAQAGKRPAEYVGNDNFKIYGGDKDRFITVIDKRTGFVEAFFDKTPKVTGLVQIPNVPLNPQSTAYQQRQTFYQYLGANQPSYKAGR